MNDGYPIVLTADRSLIAGYRLLFDGMLVASQTTTTPSPILHGLLMPRAATRDGRAMVAPLGLRRIEAALLDGGFSPDDVAVVAPDDLAHAIGPTTRLVAVSAGEPTGHGMNTSTMTAIAGGRIVPEVMCRRLLRDIRKRLDASGSKAKVLLGGPGAWQLGQPEDRAALGIDHLVTGYAEGNAAAIFRALLADEALPPVIAGEGVPVERIPRIHGASTMGVVEISRGCGLGCDFCTIARVPMQHLPVETILADIRTNIAAGQRDIAVLSEDFFRYGARGLQTHPPALLELLARIRQVDGVRLIQPDHANVISVAQYSDGDLRQAFTLLTGGTGHRFPWVNLGVESASGALLKRAGAGAKLGTYAPADWGDLCAEQVRRLCRAGFFPMVSLMLGLPGETADDIAQTLAWVEGLQHERISVFPMLLAPLDGTPGPQALTKLHWRLIRTCYKLNFRWVPHMYWDNQAAAQVPLFRRLLLQMLGRGQVVEWNALFAWHSWRATR